MTKLDCYRSIVTRPSLTPVALAVTVIGPLCFGSAHNNQNVTMIQSVPLALVQQRRREENDRKCDQAATAESGVSKG